ncbi:MAG: hypothetical protein M9899_02475 [Bdellovibrionaceae bacterium]|nr:hypothetical protein [Pseudobdellovibrionaceae bacterium]
MNIKLSVAIAGIIFVANPSGASEGAMTCSLPDFAKLCSEVPDSNEAFVDLPGGLIMANPNSTKPPKPLTPEQKQKATQRLRERFVWVKNQMIQQASGGRPVGQLDSVKAEFVKRLQTLELLIDDNCRSSDALGGRYVSTKHKVSICLHNGLTSDSQLTWILGHEAGHSVDGCKIQCEHYHRKQPIPTIAGAQGQDTNYAIGEMNTSNYFSAGFSSILSKPEEISSRLSTWESQGLIERTLEGVPPAHYPLTPALSCLAKEKFITAESGKVKEGEECNRGGVVSETSSDMWGAKMAGLYLKQKPPQTKLEKLASLSKEAVELMCKKRTGPKPLPALDSPLWENQRPSDSRYIIDRDRDEATLLADQNMQKALGCSPQPNRQTCMSHFDQAFSGGGTASGARGSDRSSTRTSPRGQQSGAPAQTVD